MASKFDHYDILCIGSSPLCLLEALHHARMGRRVFVVEAADKLGGAWRDTSVMGMQGAEIGPHIITFNANTYDFFQRELGLQMIPLEPLPAYLIKTPIGLFRLPYHFSPFIAYVAVPYHLLTNAGYRARLSELKEEYLGRLSDAARLTGRWLFSSRKPRLLYPKGGTAALMRSITSQIEASGIEVGLKTVVHSLNKCADGSIVADFGDHRLRANHVIMTVHQHLEKVADERKEHRLNTEPRRYTILHLLIKSQRPQRITFALAKHNPIFNLISNIAPYLPEPLDPTFRLLTVRLVNWDRPRDRAEVEKFVRSLSENVIVSDAQLIDFEFSEYDQSRLTKESAAVVQGVLGNSVTLLRSTNFANSIGERVKTWRSAPRAGYVNAR